MESHSSDDHAPVDDQAPKPKPEAKPVPRPVASRLPSWIVSLVILAIAAGIFLLVYGDWDKWESGKTVQATDDTYGPMLQP
jgi:hypothetical protein